MTFIPSLLGKIDANNSTTTNLSNTNANTFTGTATNVSGYNITKHNNRENYSYC